MPTGTLWIYGNAKSKKKMYLEIQQNSIAPTKTYQNNKYQTETW